MHGTPHRFYFHNLNFSYQILFSAHTTDEERNVSSDLPACLKLLKILKYLHHKDSGNISKYINRYSFQDFQNELESTEHVQIRSHSYATPTETLSNYEEYHILGSDDVYGTSRTFRWNVLPPSSGYKSELNT
jgi:hypothetical protein